MYERFAVMKLKQQQKTSLDAATDERFTLMKINITGCSNLFVYESKKIHENRVIRER